MKFNEILHNITSNKGINEMSPQNIDALDLDRYQQGIKDYYKKNKSKFKPTYTKNLLKSGDDHNGYYIFIKEDVIYYFVRYKSLSYSNLSNNRMMRQVLVQRFNSSTASVGIPKIVFFDYLLPTFGTIVTDTEQTADGKRFWMSAVVEALNNPSKYEVYIFDRSNVKNSVIKINSLEHFETFENTIWGDSEMFKYKLIAISLK